MKLYAEETCLDEIVCGGNLRTFHRSAHCAAALLLSKVAAHSAYKAKWVLDVEIGKGFDKINHL
jgi:retron-type reverse transcriptase